MAGMSLTVPSSLLTSISDTRKVSSRMASRTACALIRPSASGTRYVTATPLSCNCFAVSRMALCSIWLVMMWPPDTPRAWATPLRARLLDSVAPEVQTICSGVAPTSSATWRRACSTVCRACWPKAWELEAGLPKLPSKPRHSTMILMTRSSTGVVAA
ncbi:hypothetical protein FQZ97_1099590 [compost metagenome]